MSPRGEDFEREEQPNKSMARELETKENN